MNDQTKLPEDEQFAVRHPKEICQILRELRKSKAILNVSFNHGHDQCLTNIIGVDAEKYVVYLDVGLDAGFNRRLLDSNHMIFTKDDGIRVRWTSAKIALVKLKDGEALKIALPKSLIRLQRREFFRCPTPVANPLLCHIPYRHPLTPNVVDEMELMLLDVSLGGIGTVLSGPLPPVVEVGTVFEDCKLKLPEFGEISISLSVRNVKEITLKSGAHRHRIGLQFAELSKVDERIIQRYVFNLEREALAIAKGD
jgi:flagellar brake protein